MAFSDTNTRNKNVPFYNSSHCATQLRCTIILRPTKDFYSVEYVIFDEFYLIYFYFFSFYENILKNSQKSSEKIAVTSKSNTLRAVTATSLDSSSIMELHSVSEQALCCSGSVPSKRSTKKRVLPPDPIVGKLGPDIMAMKEKVG